MAEKIKNKRKLQRLAELYAKQSEGWHNGDKHPALIASADKERHSKLWGKDAEATAEAFAKLAEESGYVASFDAGLYPTLTKKDDSRELSLF